MIWTRNVWEEGKHLFSRTEVTARESCELVVWFVCDREANICALGRQEHFERTQTYSNLYCRSGTHIIPKYKTMFIHTYQLTGLHVGLIPFSYAFTHSLT